MNLPTLKVYDIDYSFILKNYLDPKLWDEKWVLFEYKEHFFSIRIRAIYTGAKRIEFEILKNNDCWGRTFYYYLDNSNIDFLKKSIRGNLLRKVWAYERSLIKDSKEFRTMQSTAETITEDLTAKVESFLDDENVSNKDIREVYIDKFLDDNDTSGTIVDGWVDDQEYKYATDMYLAYAQATNDDELIEKVAKATSQSKVNEITEQLEELQEKVDNDELDYEEI